MKKFPLLNLVNASSIEQRQVVVRINALFLKETSGFVKGRWCWVVAELLGDRGPRQ